MLLIKENTIMLQIIDLENNELFTQVSSEESVSVNGGDLASAANYNIVATAFGVIEPLRRDTTLLFTIDALTPGQ
ncbi:hypothetical protein NSMS1_47650 [Nostoc sp. MS1]|nr:hypothetical protein NSMS1_47650 [Nostoc sp. MS1]